MGVLRRSPGDAPRVIAEVKFRSPSAGQIRSWAPGEAVRVAQAYVRGGAAAVSVLADGPGFGGSNLTVRRVARACPVPVLYKGFVMEAAQVAMARALGASMVLLLVRALSPETLRTLVHLCVEQGISPLVEAADARELGQALETDASLVGMNARDLSSFRVDLPRAARFLEALPSDKVGVLMSGIRGRDELDIARESRADAVLVGEGLMRASDPGARLEEWTR